MALFCRRKDKKGWLASVLHHASSAKRASAVKAAKGIALMTNTVPLAHRASNAFSDFLHTVFPKKPWPILWAQSAWEGIKAEHKILSVMYMGDGNANYTRPERLTVLMCIIMGTMLSLSLMFEKSNIQIDPTADFHEYIVIQVSFAVIGALVTTPVALVFTLPAAAWRNDDEGGQGASDESSRPLR